MSELLTTINPLLPLLNVVFMGIIFPIYKIITNQQEEIKLLKATLQTQREELILLQEIVFDMADASKIKEIMIKRGRNVH